MCTDEEGTGRGGDGERGALLALRWRPALCLVESAIICLPALE